MNGGVSMKCPHCESRAIARTSKTLSLTLREITFVCRNHRCGFVWVATLEAARTLSPPAVPNHQVRLPLSAHINRAGLVTHIAEAQLALQMEPP